MFSQKPYITKFDYMRIDKYLASCGSPRFPFYKLSLKDKMKKARLVEPQEIKPTVITMNSKFKLKNLGTGKKQIYTLVFPEDANSTDNKLSILDPNGVKLFASEKGEVIRWQNSEESYFLIEDIIYQPEASGDYHL
jgi:regulator of nucleoside diphosphate kinase